MIKIGKLLKSLAPTVAEAAGGPLAGMAVKMVASKMGVPEASAEKIEEILETQPEKAVLVREADQDFKTKIREMEIDLESFKTEVDDRKDARKTFGDDPVPKDICYGCANRFSWATSSWSQYSLLTLTMTE